MTRLDSKPTELARSVLVPDELGREAEAQEVESLVIQLTTVITDHLDSLGLEPR